MILILQLYKKKINWNKSNESNEYTNTIRFGQNDYEHFKTTIGKFITNENLNQDTKKVIIDLFYEILHLIFTSEIIELLKNYELCHSQES